MYKRFETVGFIPFQDNRGSLKKIAAKSTMGADIEEVYVLYSNKGAVRGNHYHKETVEYFTVLEGTAVFALKDLETGYSDTFTVSSDDNIIVKVPVNVVHAFKNEEDRPLIVLAVSSREYNANATDTYPDIIIN